MDAENTYDLVVIGTGNAGTAMSLEARREGWRVAIVDELPFGGTCALKGCVPKKVLTGAADLTVLAKSMRNKGIDGDIRIKWHELMSFKKTFTDPIPLKRSRTYAERGLDAYNDHARFLGRNTLLVGDKILTSRFIGIATGAVPRRLGIPGERFASSSDDFLAMEAIPKRILFIGGGFISFEFAHVAVSAGAKVTILQRSNRILKNFDPFLVDILLKAFRASGVEIHIDMPVKSIEKASDRLLVHAGKDEEFIFEADMVVHGAGRIPNIESLDLKAGELSVDESGIVINQYLQSISNPSVYVAGDANGRGKQLTPVARRDGQIAAKNMIHNNILKTEYNTVPSVVFTSPLLASVGCREDEVEKRVTNAVVHKRETSDWYSSRRMGIAHSGYKIITEGESGRIIGAHLLGYNADETINLFALAIKLGIGLADLQEMAWAYPTAAYDINRIQ